MNSVVLLFLARGPSERPTNRLDPMQMILTGVVKLWDSDGWRDIRRRGSHGNCQVR